MYILASRIRLLRNANIVSDGKASELGIRNFVLHNDICMHFDDMSFIFCIFAS